MPTRRALVLGLLLTLASCGDDDASTVDASPGCPADMPDDGASCATQGLLCFYDDRSGEHVHECVACSDWPCGLVTECNGRGEFRHIDRSACDDGGASGTGGSGGTGGTSGTGGDLDASTGCPTDMPADNTPCATEGLLCFYESSNGGLELSYECIACTDWPCAGLLTECNGSWFAHIDRTTCEGGLGDDGGLDARVSDAALDAMPSTDATVEDASTTDAASIDASTGDAAMTLDAETLDATAADATTADATTRDASALDAGSDAGGVDFGGNNRVAAAQFCTRLAELQCAAEAHCCTNALRRYPSHQACVTGQSDVCEDEFHVTQIGSAASAAYSIDRAETVLDGFQSRVQLCDLDVAAWGVSTMGFQRMFEGTRSVNALCSPASSSDYAAAVSCRFDDGLTCVPGIPGLQGLPPTLWSCKPRSVSGGNCFSDLNCADGLRCLVPETLSACGARKANGQTCAAPHECESLLCESDVCVERNLDDVYCLGG